MRTNHIKAALAKGETVFGAWVGLPNPLILRLTARVGFDWLMVDMEHSPINFTLMTEMVGVIADAHGPAPFVRVPSFSVENIKRVLDSGAWGVLIPMVNSVTEAEQIVSACKYPPDGTRSIGGAYGPLAFDTVRSEYAAKANQEVMVAIQIESKLGLENVDAIMSVPGIDLVFIGPNDLHASLGLLPSLESTEPIFLKALETIKTAAARHHIPVGILASSGDAARQRAREGFRFVGASSDAGALLTGLTQDLRAARGL
ncbi:MAG: 2-dehydro-3-deoxyglucarate aldolase [Chloroflexi bacterium]|nr:2-dehydro-3-deoxyglucarate aldolase [Chloroflexota bacterium]